MKKILSVLCLCMVVIFCFTGCSTNKKIDAYLLAQQNIYKDYGEYLDIDQSIFSDDLLDEYNYNNKGSIDFNLKPVNESPTTFIAFQTYDNETLVEEFPSYDTIGKKIITIQKSDNFDSIRFKANGSTEDAEMVIDVSNVESLKKIVFGFNITTINKDFVAIEDFQMYIVSSLLDSIQISITDLAESNSTECKIIYKNNFESQSTLKTLEKLIQTSNIASSRLKVYLENDTIRKKLNKKSINNLTKEMEIYNNSLAQMHKSIDSLEDVIKRGGSNTQTDYKNLTIKISELLLNGCNLSNTLINTISNYYNFNFSNDLESLSYGQLELMVLKLQINVINTYTKIYLVEAEFDKFINYGTQIIDPLKSISNELELLSSIQSAKFDLKSSDYINLRNKIIIISNLNMVYNTKAKSFDMALESFDYNNFKLTAAVSYPNDSNVDQIKNYSESEKIDINEQNNYKLISFAISEQLVPSISVLQDVLTSISSL